MKDWIHSSMRRIDSNLIMDSIPQLFKRPRSITLIMDSNIMASNQQHSRISSSAPAIHFNLPQYSLALNHSPLRHCNAGLLFLPLRGERGCKLCVSYTLAYPDPEHLLKRTHSSSSPVVSSGTGKAWSGSPCRPNPGLHTPWVASMPPT